MRKKVDHIRLIKPSTAVNNESATTAQGTLFQIASDHLLVFVSISSISDSMFLSILKNGVLRVFDLRVAPRFDIGDLTRSRVFDFFNECQIEYFDLPGSLSVMSRYDVRLNPESIAPLISSKICQNKTLGPNVFLLEDDERAQEFASLLPRSLPTPTKRTWEVLVPRPNPFTEARLKSFVNGFRK